MKSSDELVLLGVSITLLVVIVGAAFFNADHIELFFKTKVGNRWIGY